MGSVVEPLAAKMTAHCNRVAVEDGHTESVSIKLGRKATREEMMAAWAEFAPLQGRDLPTAPAQPVEFVAAEDRPQPRLDKMRGAGMAATVGRLRPCGLLDWKFTVLSHNTIRGSGGRGSAERGAAGIAGQARSGGSAGMNRLVVMKFGGTSVEDASAILRTARIVAGRVAQGLQPVVVVSAMAKVTDLLISAAATAARGDRATRAGDHGAAEDPALRHGDAAGDGSGAARRSDGGGAEGRWRWRRRTRGWTRSSMGSTRFCAGWRWWVS